MKGSCSNGFGIGGNGGRLNLFKSVEERKEEYNKVYVLGGKFCLFCFEWFL